MPGPNRSQGYRRSTQSRVGQPRDQDGRPQGGAERRGGRTYKPGLHDWTPGAAPARGADRPGARAYDRDAARQQSRTNRQPGANARPGQGAGGRFGTAHPAARSAMRPGSMGAGGATNGSAANARPDVPRRDQNGRTGGTSSWPGRDQGSRFARGQGRQRGETPPATGAAAGRTRFGSEEPRDNGDRSRYRSTAPAGQQHRYRAQPRPGERPAGGGAGRSNPDAGASVERPYADLDRVEEPSVSDEPLLGAFVDERAGNLLHVEQPQQEPAARHLRARRLPKSAPNADEAEVNGFQAHVDAASPARRVTRRKVVHDAAESPAEEKHGPAKRTRRRSAAS